MEALKLELKRNIVKEQQYATHLSDTVDYYAAWRAQGGMVGAGGGSGFHIDSK